MPRGRAAAAKKNQGRKRKAVKDDPIKKEPDEVPKKQAKDDIPASSKDQEDVEIKKVTFTGTAPVDEQCPLAGYHVYVDKTTSNKYKVYNAMLNQTNIGANNNKYYILQLLEHDSKFEYATWFRWGRVGKVAGTTLKMHASNFLAARGMFWKKFSEKSGNQWSFLSYQSNPVFMKMNGKYDLLEMDYGEEEEKKEKEVAKKKVKEEVKEIPSKLDPRVQEVIDLIFNVNEFEASVKEMEFDVKKAPLGKLTTTQIKAGYETLKKIEKCIQKGDFGEALNDACSEFYTRIPHDFGMKRPPLIKTPQQLKKKIELLEALGDIQIAIEMIKNDENEDKKNIKDKHYESLGCKLEPFDRKDEEFKLIKCYIENSHGSTHNQYTLEVENLYKVERDSDSRRFKDSIGNKMLLWHGSRLTNWCGILKQGLRIAPPEAPVTGYMFGKGVYFADMVSKSANYCFANPRQPHGFLLLCEVALGETNDKIYGDYHANKLPNGKSSTKGLGREIPNPKGRKALNCGTVIPLGKPMKAKDRNNCCLMYNEYIVYDVAQIKPRYLVKTKFNFPSMW